MDDVSGDGEQARCVRVYVFIPPFSACGVCSIGWGSAPAGLGRKSLP